MGSVHSQPSPAPQGEFGFQPWEDNTATSAAPPSAPPSAPPAHLADKAIKDITSLKSELSAKVQTLVVSMHQMRGVIATAQATSNKISEDLGARQNQTSSLQSEYVKLKSTQLQGKSGEGSLSQLSKDIGELKAKIQNLESSKTKIDAKMDELKSDLANKTEQLKAAREELKDLNRLPFSKMNLGETLDRENIMAKKNDGSFKLTKADKESLSKLYFSDAAGRQLFISLCHDEGERGFVKGALLLEAMGEKEAFSIRTALAADGLLKGDVGVQFMDAHTKCGTSYDLKWPSEKK